MWETQLIGVIIGNYYLMFFYGNLLSVKSVTVNSMMQLRFHGNIHMELRFHGNIHMESNVSREGLNS